MARDNGKRGSYRHVSGSLAKQTNDHNELDHPSPIVNSPTDSNASPPLPTNFTNLRRDKIDDLSVLGDAFFDSVPSSLNAKYPSMAVPGSMPRLSLSPQRVTRDQSPTWNETIFAAGLLGFAIIGFLYTMYHGFLGMAVYVWALVTGVFGRSA
ncbi:hypothetical protein N0V93_009914 [Gnomoniopsis smithogilvyi]|uniref:Uncharacterized protein n=1 Tax=Gnomoniopsis smithogilvyi TaxID=1191159 RepID=A0A9W8YK61_9PEZI|nr:hypothetical protein N0V93_009914 [Gnomoniopsis smithogilvyi]